MTSHVLSGDDFRAFFEAIHHVEPFSWQVRLAQQVVETGRWPKLVDLPTGTGKTAVLDIAVFSLALRHDMPRRTVFVVDRRIVVHQASQRARAIVEALISGADPVVAAVASGLRALAPDPHDAEEHPPLRWTELRGGIVRDESWALRPDVPAVLLSTVDQIGSRLLFRGYGVSRGMRPIHAGLLGNDALILLDEVHLARPFRSTLAAIHARYRQGSGGPIPDRWQVAELSATPSDRPVDSEHFSLTADDVDPTVSPTLHRRLSTSKPAATQLVPTSGKDAGKHRAALARAAVEATTALIDEGAKTVGVVVNRVATAVAAYRILQERGKVQVELLTGRMRPLDRDDVLQPLANRIMTGRVRSPSDEPVVLVSTQAIEAGADLDLDALVTECAPLDALRQRFGRVDRDGQGAVRGAPPTSVILATAASVADGSDDPIYGASLRATWAALQDRRIDFGYLTGTLSDLVVPDRLAALTPPSTVVPQLLPSHLDRWAQTSDPPHADPVPAHWLHGLVANVEDITVVWRADLCSATFAGTEEAVSETLTGVLTAVPVAAGETMAVSSHAVKAWLADALADGTGLWADGSANMGDVAIGSPDPDDDRRGRRRPIRPVAVANGERVEVARLAGSLRPGATIVVPASYGGITAGSWDPTATEDVDDLATRAMLAAKGRLVLRLTPETLPDLGDWPSPPIPSTDLDLDRAEEEAAVREWLAETATRMASRADEAGAELTEVEQVLDRLAAGRPTITRVAVAPATADGEGGAAIFVVAMSAQGGARNPLGDAGGDTVDSEPETSSFIGRAVSLDQHLSDVERWARALATSCGFSQALIDDLALAGRAHDLGKADARFQLMLRGGVVSGDDVLLAKSASTSYDRRARVAAARAAAYPRGARHEMVSVALIEHVPELMARANDWDLVLHLVASHHGYARPFAPVSVDAAPVPVEVELSEIKLEATSDPPLARIDAGIADRFWRLTRRYGWWGLSWLESVLRLADHRASSAAQRHPHQEEVAS